jgi:hypothetical protein
MRSWAIFVKDAWHDAEVAGGEDGEVWGERAEGGDGVVELGVDGHDG